MDKLMPIVEIMQHGKKDWTFSLKENPIFISLRFTIELFFQRKCNIRFTWKISFKHDRWTTRI
jgi:hypothetical protein